MGVGVGVGMGVGMAVSTHGGQRAAATRSPVVACRAAVHGLLLREESLARERGARRVDAFGHRAEQALVGMVQDQEAPLRPNQAAALRA